MPLPTLKPRIALHRPPSMGNAVTRTRGSWLQREREHLFREHPLCAGCLRKAPERIRAATQRDHIIPLWKGGKDERANTQGLCDECHTEKSASEAKERGGG